MSSAPEPGTGEPRIGRPPKVDQHGTPTRERLLNAAVDACVEHGYDGVTLSEIARRADVSTPAVYSHFSGKAELMVAASKRELIRLSDNSASPDRDLVGTMLRWIQPDNDTIRRLILELHSAATRYPEVAELLDHWTEANARVLADQFGMNNAQLKLMYLTLLGLAHHRGVDLNVSDAALEAEIRTMVAGWIPFDTSADRHGDGAT